MTELKKLAEQLARGRTSFEDARRRAREVISGQVRNVHGLPPTRVLPSMRELDEEFHALSTYLNELPYDKLERWAGAFVMLHAQLALGNLQPAADLVRRVAATNAPSERAAEIAVAMIDAVLEHSEQLPTPLLEQLMAARRAKLASPERSADTAAAFDIVLQCFDHEGWQYVADRDARKVMIQFHFPFGETRLVSSVSDDGSLTVFALEVLRVAAHAMAEIEQSLASGFAGVRAERDDALGWVTLLYTLAAADSLVPREVRRAVVHVNGAAEHLMMSMRAMSGSTESPDYTRRLLAYETWWKRLLDVQRPYRWHVRRLELGRVLDIGCGVGRNLSHLGPGAPGVGVDHNAHSVAVARSRGLVAFTPEEFLASPEAKAATYDALLLAHVAEHMRRDEVVALLRLYLPFVRPGGRVVLITPQEAGYRSDPTHVELMDFAKTAGILGELGLEILRQYSFPFFRLVGKVFRHNEFVTIGRKA